MGCKALTVGMERVPVTPEETPRDIGLIAPELRAIFRELVTGQKPWPFLLSGRAGRGKTAAALCLADHVRGAVYYRFPRLLKSFLWSQKEHGVAVTWPTVQDGRLGWKSMNCNEHDFFKYLSRAPLLILDDVATRSGYTDAQYDNFYELLDDRQFKPTVVISNLSLSEIGEVFDERIASRLARGTLFTLGGPDRRISAKPSKPLAKAGKEQP